MSQLALHVMLCHLHAFPIGMCMQRKRNQDESAVHDLRIACLQGTWSQLQASMAAHKHAQQSRRHRKVYWAVGAILVPVPAAAVTVRWLRR